MKEQTNVQLNEPITNKRTGEHMNPLIWKQPELCQHMLGQQDVVHLKVRWPFSPTGAYNDSQFAVFLHLLKM